MDKDMSLNRRRTKDGQNGDRQLRFRKTQFLGKWRVVSNDTDSTSSLAIMQKSRRNGKVHMPHHTPREMAAARPNTHCIRQGRVEAPLTLAHNGNADDVEC